MDEKDINEKKSAENKNGGEENKKSKSRMILLIIAVVVFVCACVYIGFYLYNVWSAENETTVPQESTAALTTGPLAQNPVDFKSLQSGNDEIYAWIKIDDTDVDYPIVQSGSDDDFYLRHSAFDKKYISSGAIYTQGINRTDFTDPVTVIYGHNGYKETMFTTLHMFEDSEFFNSHEYFYIYMPQHKLTYQIISAFKYDDRHIMNSFNFDNQDDLASFQGEIMNPSSALKNVRTNLNTTIDKDSKIVVLSTCITNQKSNRFLVCGVLIKDEKTN